MNPVQSIVTGLAFLSVLSVSPAQAQSTSRVAVTDFSYTVTDLDPSDNYLPAAIDWSQSEALYSYALSSRQIPQSQLVSDDGWLRYKAFTKNVDADNTSISLAADSANNPSVSTSITGYGKTYASLYMTVPVVVMPHTSISFMSHVDVSMVREDGIPWETAYLSFSMGIWGEDTPTTPGIPQGFSTSLSEPGNWADDPMIGFINNGDQAVELSFGMSTRMWLVTDYPLNPVPEPSTWITLLSGIGMVALTLRRRRAMAVAHDAR